MEKEIVDDWGVAWLRLWSFCFPKSYSTGLIVWKDQITLPLVWGILADYWVPHEIGSWKYQNLFGLGFHEVDSLKKSKKPAKNIHEFWFFFKGSPLWKNKNISFWMSSNERFHKNQTKSEIFSCLMWNPEICQDSPKCDLVLLPFFEMEE